MADDKPAEKKDLTGIIEVQKALMDSGQAPPAPAGSVMEDVPIEKIDDFESLEDYSVSHPLPPPSEDSPPAETAAAEPTPVETLPSPEPPPPQDPPPEAAPPFEAAPASNEFGTSDFPVTEQESSPPSGQDLAQPSPPEMAVTPEFQTSDFPAADSPPADAPNTDFPTSDPSPSASPMSFDSSSSDFPPSDPAPPEPQETPLDPPVQEASPSLPPTEAEAPLAAPEPTPVAPPPPVNKTPTVDIPKPPLTPMEKVKNYSEKVTTGKPAVPAAYPFSLLITATLRPEEKDRLLDLLSRENMGIREIDLEPQFAGGKILIPRISEYAAILIVQALRGVRGQIKIGPSDRIFSTADTRADKSEEVLDSEEENETSMTSEVSHPAERLPITPEDRLPGLPRFSVVDTVTATAALKSNVVEAENSPQYQEVVEALQRELKYKAYRKGATAVINFKIQLNFLSSPTHYRLHAIGLAVKPLAREENPPPPRPNRPVSV